MRDCLYGILFLGPGTASSLSYSVPDPFSGWGWDSSCPVTEVSVASPASRAVSTEPRWWQKDSRAHGDSLKDESYRDVLKEKGVTVKTIVKLTSHELEGRFNSG